MATARPFVSVYQCGNPTVSEGGVAMPAVLVTPIRPDHIRYVHTQIAKNARQAYAVSTNSGYQSSAESWGTGRAVARIPRVSGGGTHRAGQGAFGNMCRGGGMFAPTKTWRRWHRKVNETEKRHAVASALAASAVPAIVMARGHRIDAVPEVPCVLSNDVENLPKTSAALGLLKKLGCEEELNRVNDSKTIRAGSGKRRNNKYSMRRGPLFVYAGEKTCERPFRNIPGVECCHVDRLNLLQLAPGGSVGRFIIYSQAAFEKLSAIWGTADGGASKKGYVLPRPMMTNTDLARLINSNEIQSIVAPMKNAPKRKSAKRNPLTNYAVRCRVDPAFKVRKTTVKK